MIRELGTKLYIFFYCKFVGKDSFGNCYYQSKRKYPEYRNSNRRLVLFNGKVEATKIPPMFHAWMRHTIKEFPKTVKNYAWQKSYESNLTGTRFAYHPADREIIDTSIRISKQYEAWHPYNNS